MVRLVPAIYVLLPPPYPPPHAGEGREGEDVDARDNPRIKSGPDMTAKGGGSPESSPAMTAIENITIYWRGLTTWSKMLRFSQYSSRRIDG
jgi:hypothetical protein